MTSSRLGKRETCMRPVGVPLVHLLRKDAWVSSHVERFGCNHPRCLMVTVVLSRNIGGHPRENVCRKARHISHRPPKLQPSPADGGWGAV
jgi:hypothetical protein